MAVAEKKVLKKLRSRTKEPPLPWRGEPTLRAIIEGIACLPGKNFFESLARYLVTTLGVDYAYVAKLDADKSSASILALGSRGKIMPLINYTIKDTPCEKVTGRDFAYYPENVQSYFPNDPYLRDWGIECFMGTSCLSLQGESNGILAIMHRTKKEHILDAKAMLQVLAVITGAEIDREELITKLIEERNNAERASKLKDQFLANVRHEIRTPAAVILGASEFMQIHDKDDHRYICHQILEKNIAKLVAVIDDIIDMSKIEIGDYRLKKSYCHPGEILDEVYISMLARAEQRNLEFKQVVGSDLPQQFYTDQEKVKEILLRLLDNAFKFTKTGSIAIGADGRGEGLEFWVEDTGAGIASDDIELLFKPFVRHDVYLLREYEGLGLGLALCRKIIELMGGTITVKSEVGKGSIFTITLPGV